MAHLTRRDLLRAIGYSGMGMLAGCRTQRPAAAAGWYRGNLHMHTYWSDGKAFPEQAISIYKNLGYDFICLSDHNVFADDPGCWRPVGDKLKGWPPPVGKEIFEEYRKEFGGEVETRQEDGRALVRLKTYKEMARRFNESGKFLLLPGVEITQHIPPHNVQVHMNYVNLPDVIPFVKGGPLNKLVTEEGMDASNIIRKDAEEVQAMSAKMRRPSLLTLNHPQWIYWDILPQNLIDNPEVRFFEVCNGGSAFEPHPEAANVSTDSFWDTINAFRSLHGAPLLFGIGTDDTHNYINRTANQRLADAWVMVRCTGLTPESLISAMLAGDFYATTGVTLEDVAFKRSSRTLSVRVKAAPEVKYRISFITTKRGFDQSVRTVHCPAVKGRGDRTIPVYSNEIGKTVKRVEGSEAAYRMAPDDLYVRAKIESSVPSRYKSNFHPIVEVAWTQPYA
ncbi:MAG: hypothetical protein PHO37_00320 [Kiritimatiellae bacterium]|nr:hypothetical protein [Kiritimatiellia bacterium]